MPESLKALILPASRPETLEVTVLRDLSQKRNCSILVHGFEPMDGKSAVRFLEYVEAPEAGAEHARLRGL
jgi:hypothetical protein